MNPFMFVWSITVISLYLHSLVYIPLQYPDFYNF
jgi:hypothetical protein